MQPGSSQFGGSTSAEQQVGLVGMQIIRGLLQKSGFSDDIIDVVMSSWRLTNNTIRTSTSGYTFVVNNKLIPCIPL